MTKVEENDYVARMHWIIEVWGIAGVEGCAVSLEEYAKCVAKERGREEPTRKDVADGFARMIDVAIVTHGKNALTGSESVSEPVGTSGCK